MSQQEFLDTLAEPLTNECPILLDVVKGLLRALCVVENQCESDHLFACDLNGAYELLWLLRVDCHVAEVLKLQFDSQVTLDIVLISEVCLEEAQPNRICHVDQRQHKTLLRHVFSLCELQSISFGLSCQLEKAVLVLLVLGKLNDVVLVPQGRKTRIFCQDRLVTTKIEPAS